MHWLERLLPASLVNRVFMLYSLSLLLFVGGGLLVFLRFQFYEEVESTQVASVMVIEVVAQAVQDSVVIGDYDTVHKTLDKAVQASLFKSARFIDMQAGKVVARSRTRPPRMAPQWVENYVAGYLYDVNRTVSVGGRDYGVIRLEFDTAIVAGSFWSLAEVALTISVVSLIGGLLLIRLLLLQWLGGLERLRDLVEDLGTGAVKPETLDAHDAPLEIRRVVEIFNQTAVLIRDREATRRALDDQKFALDQHAIVSMTDVDGNITYANDLFCQISGYTRDELIGKTHRIIGSQRMPRAFFDTLWATITSGQVWNGEICNRNRDGGLYWVNATIVPLLDDEGRPKQFIAIRTDITAMKAAEVAILRAKETAEQANRIKSDFLANMSHEIRTPMNGIIGMTELALDTELTDEQADYLRMVRFSAGSLLQIINDILDFSKLEAGRLDVEQIEFSLEGMLHELVRSQAIEAHEKSLELLLRIEPAVPERIISDPGRLRQIVLNLVGNAIKFTHHGEIEISVSRINRPGDALADIRISVRDTGIGIPQAKFADIFDAFSQVDTSTTRQYGGTGLGLSISSQLARLMGGMLTLESAVGAGSTFHLTLQVPTVRVRAATGPANRKLAGMRVLVADDNATNRSILTGVLRNLDMQPAAAPGAEPALAELHRARLAGEPYELALLDVQMPGVDGFELARQIRAQPLLAGLKIMMLTSEGRRGDAARCRELGLESYLVKPVSRWELLQAVSAAFGEQASDDMPLITRHTIQQAKRQLRLLVAEDNEVNQILALRLLQKHGHIVTLAGTGLEAVQQWRSQPFDAILMDIDMPDMDGYEASMLVRREEGGSGKRIPIIALTAHAMRGAREKCIAHGMDSYLAKPIDPVALQRELDGIGAQAPASAISFAVAHPVDFAAVREKMDYSRELFEEIVALFLRDMPKEIARLKQHAAEGDADGVRRDAHTIRGMVSMFSSGAAAQVTNAIEARASHGRLDGLLAELEQAVDAIGDALSAYRWEDDCAALRQPG